MANPTECRFSKTHEWLQIEGDICTVGISDHAQKEITDVVFVELPQAGRVVKQGESIAVVESVKAAFDIYAPVDGEILEVNDEVVQNPALVNESPYEKAWFYKIKLSDAQQASALMDHAAYEAFLQSAAS
jgi:glycine cleavage system H protein